MREIKEGLFLDKEEKGLSTFLIVLTVVIVGVSLGASAYILTRPKPNIQIEEMTVSQEKIAKEEPVTVKVKVSNTGGAEGSKNIPLEINGEVFEIRKVNLNTDESKTVSFEITEGELGSFKVSSGELLKTVEVVEPAEFNIENLRLSPEEVKLGETVTISVDIRNTGGVKGSEKLGLRIDSSLEKSKYVTLAPEESTTMSFNVKKKTSKSYSVKIGSLSSSFKVLTPAKFEVSNLQVEPKEASSGESVTISAKVKNIGEVRGKYSAELRINDKFAKSEEVTLSPGEEKVVTFETSGSEIGTYFVSLRDLSDKFEVGGILIEGKDLREELIKFDWTALVDVSVQNTASESRSALIWCEVIQGANSWRKSKDVHLQSLEGKIVRFSFPEPEYLAGTCRARVWVGAETEGDTQQEAEFKVSNLQINPSEAEPEQTVTISVDVKNTGNVEGSYELNLKIDGATEQTKTKTLGAKKSTSVSFDFSRKEAGIYEVDIENLTSQFEVVSRWDLVTEYDGLMWSQRKHDTDTFKIEEDNWRVNWKASWIGTNTSQLPLLIISVVSENGKEVIGEMDSGHRVKDKYSGTGTFQEKGQFYLYIMGQYISWKIEIEEDTGKKAKFETNNLRLSSSEVKPGETVEVSVDVSNTGDESGEHTVDLKIDGTLEASKTVSLKGGEKTTVSFTVVKEEKKTYSIEVDGLSGSFEVKSTIEEANFTFETTLRQATGEIEALDFSPNNEYIAYGSKDSKVYVHSTEDWSLISSFGELSVKIRNLKFSPNNQFVAFTYEDKSNLYIYSTSTWSKVATLTKSGGEVKRFSFSTNSDLIAYSSKDTNVYVHSTDDWSNIATLSQATSTVHPVRFSPDGKYIAYGELDGHVHVHSTGDWTQLEIFNLGGWIRSIDFTPNSDQIAFGGNSGEVQVYTTGTWNSVKTFDTGKKIRSITFSPDGQMISYGADSTSYVNSTSDWSLEEKFTDQSPYVFTTIFSPDSKYFVYNSSGDEKVFAYTTEDWSKVETFDSSRGRFGFSPDGSMFAVQNNEIVRVYNVE
ncbi:hypothetical protein AKJ66_02535 [candidate division MSBL1 archaeon SCGC-AAA259E22]|uniref:Uncharacterized protein n=1 Tax=candidate division MSBL1 archaeon SCGC-AAA259E22 TaxID=1698265 RepID=A0A133UGC4_9EURY|nr:hypothetical protein AKJ66_02535 [candidate division MSBL1 archaeon SCGC-AAA259E22]